MEKDPIISQNIRVRYPEFFKIGKNSIVDDFCYFSTKVELGFNCHLAPFCSSIGGVSNKLHLFDYVGVSAGVRFVCGSDDFIDDLAIPVPKEWSYTKIGNGIYGDIVVHDYTIIGTNAVIMPANDILEGVAIGTTSYVPANFSFEPWAVYVGIPIRKIKMRNKDKVLQQVYELERLRYDSSI